VTRKNDDVPVRGTKTAFHVIEGLKTLQGAGVTELADHLDMSKSGVHNHLQTLHMLEYVRRDGDTFRLGQRFLELGERARSSAAVYRVGKPTIDNLARTSGGLAGVLVHEYGDGVYLYCKKGKQITERTALGDGTRVPLHATAGGKAILANLPDEGRESVLDTDELNAVTEYTVTSRPELEDELQTIRESGVAYENQEYEPGYHGVAVPVTGRDGTMTGAVSVTAATEQISGRTLEENISGQVLSAGKKLERKLLEEAR